MYSYRDSPVPSHISDMGTQNTKPTAVVQFTETLDNEMVFETTPVENILQIKDMESCERKSIFPESVLNSQLFEGASSNSSGPWVLQANSLDHSRYNMLDLNPRAPLVLEPTSLRPTYCERPSQGPLTSVMLKTPAELSAICGEHNRGGSQGPLTSMLLGQDIVSDLRMEQMPILEAPSTSTFYPHPSRYIDRSAAFRYSNSAGEQPLGQARPGVPTYTSEVRARHMNQTLVSGPYALETRTSAVKPRILDFEAPSRTPGAYSDPTKNPYPQEEVLTSRRGWNVHAGGIKRVSLEDVDPEFWSLDGDNGRAEVLLDRDITEKPLPIADHPSVERVHDADSFTYSYLATSPPRLNGIHGQHLSVTTELLTTRERVKSGLDMFRAVADMMRKRKIKRRYQFKSTVERKASWVGANGRMYRNKNFCPIGTCAFSTLGFREFSELASHLEHAHMLDMRRVCPFCERVFSRPDASRRHIRTKHDEDAISKYVQQREQRLKQFIQANFTSTPEPLKQLVEAYFNEIRMQKHPEIGCIMDHPTDVPSSWLEKEKRISNAANLVLIADNCRTHKFQGLLLGGLQATIGLPQPNFHKSCDIDISI